jgi:hypothetical protein
MMLVAKWLVPLEWASKMPKVQPSMNRICDEMDKKWAYLWCQRLLSNMYFECILHFGYLALLFLWICDYMSQTYFFEIFLNFLWIFWYQKTWIWKSICIILDLALFATVIAMLFVTPHSLSYLNCICYPTLPKAPCLSHHSANLI